MTGGRRDVGLGNSGMWDAFTSFGGQEEGIMLESLSAHQQLMISSVLGRPDVFAAHLTDKPSIM